MQLQPVHAGSTCIVPSNAAQNGVLNRFIALNSGVQLADLKELASPMVGRVARVSSTIMQLSGAQRWLNYPAQSPKPAKVVSTMEFVVRACAANFCCCQRAQLFRNYPHSATTGCRAYV
jgi:hypothetical protein